MLHEVITVLLVTVTPRRGVFHHSHLEIVIVLFMYSTQLSFQRIVLCAKLLCYRQDREHPKKQQKIPTIKMSQDETLCIQALLTSGF